MRWRTSKTRAASIRAGRSVAVAQSVAVALFIVLTLTVSTGPASAQTPSGRCDDGRAWTKDSVSDGSCAHTNLCVPESIALGVEDALVWSWVFPNACPTSAIDAFGVLVDHEVALDPDLGLSSGTRRTIDSAGQAEPSTTGTGSVAVTCGLAQLTFTVVAGGELVATGEGQRDMGPCPDVTPPPTPPGPEPEPLLGLYSGATGPVGAYARLYWTVFGRVPDTAGFGYWMARSDAGLSLRGAAAIWTLLPEWEIAYADTEDREFLDRVYLNVLGRVPDPDGHAFWLAQLEDGLARDELAVQFSAAPEFRERTATD